MTGHMALMFFYSLLCALFFSHFWKQGRKDVMNMFFKIMVYMMIGGVLTAWVIFPFPLK